MTDGPTDMTDVDKTEANKKLIRSFVDDVLVSGKLDKLAGYFDEDCRGWARRWKRWRRRASR